MDLSAYFSGILPDVAAAVDTALVNIELSE
jgi:hypothetical protein